MKDVIIACDFANKEDLFEFLKPLEGMNPYLKIGMEIFYKEGPQLVKKLKENGVEHTECQIRRKIINETWVQFPLLAPPLCDSVGKL